MSAPEKQTSAKPRVGDGTPGPGRHKGVPNKMTRAVKEVIAQAAEMLGGVERLVEWVNADAKNEAAFWSSIYPKLIPVQLTGENGGPIMISRIELVAPLLPEPVTVILGEPE